ncbi:hypothetical protein ACS5NO_32170 [Larkinella sp. GY13]|uniref:hypothetical protein n=1 Tax=Larkinella sp. GY13 TaxID=3453720 RepID=UPI003EEC52E1
MTQAYPLQWPTGWPTTSSWKRARSRFVVTQDKAQREIVNEVQRLGGQNLVISTNIQIRRDGLPYTRQTMLDDPGVAVYFMLNGEQKCFACDRWDLVKDNMQAIAKTIEALRGIERWGSSKMVEQAFRGFTPLPAPTKEPAWWDVLEVLSDASIEVINANYKRLARDRHPDNGGSHQAMSDLNAARDRALYGRT